MKAVSKFSLLVIIHFVFSITAYSQDLSFFKPSDSLNITRKNTVLITEASLMAASLVGLNQMWYADYDKSSFHFKNDNTDWGAMDKTGHFYSTYHVNRLTSELLKWSGVEKEKAAYIGAIYSVGFLSTVEVFDGFSNEWGFSWGDMIANVSGSGLFISQELLWQEQRIIPKFSYSNSKYAKYRPEILGNTWNERILKDYNGQTYWLSANVESFLKTGYIPEWLNLSLGYGIDGYLSGNYDAEILNTYNFDRKSSFYLSIDVDLTRIKTNSTLLKTAFSVLNTVKIPAPTLQLLGGKDVKTHLFLF